jgi:hypothetical protein
MNSIDGLDMQTTSKVRVSDDARRQEVDSTVAASGGDGDRSYSAVHKMALVYSVPWTDSQQ